MIIRSGRPRAGINFGKKSGGPRRLFGLAGQSNQAEGTIDIANLETQYKKRWHNIASFRMSAGIALDFAPMDYTDNTTYQDPVQTAKMAQQIYVSILLANHFPNEVVYPVIYSQGDTDLANDWKAAGTTGQHWRSMIYKFKQAKYGCYNADGVYPTWGFINFDQAEKDGRDATKASNYDTNILDFIDNTRTELNEPNLPFLLSLLDPQVATASPNPVPYWEETNDAKVAAAAARDHVFTVSHTSIPMGADGIHPTQAGYLTKATNVYNAAIANGLI